MDYKELAQNILIKADSLYNENHNLASTMQVIESSVAKYGTTVSEITDMIAGDLDYEKIIWQIITDLRLSQSSNYDFDAIDDYHNDNYMLHEITRLIESQTDRFNSKTLGFINISKITNIDYDEIIKDKNLL